MSKKGKRGVRDGPDLDMACGVQDAVGLEEGGIGSASSANV